MKKLILILTLLLTNIAGATTCGESLSMFLDYRVQNELITNYQLPLNSKDADRIARQWRDLSFGQKLRVKAVLDKVPTVSKTTRLLSWTPFRSNQMRETLEILFRADPMILYRRLMLGENLDFAHRRALLLMISKKWWFESSNHYLFELKNMKARLKPSSLISDIKGISTALELQPLLVKQLLTESDSNIFAKIFRKKQLDRDFVEMFEHLSHEEDFLFYVDRKIRMLEQIDVKNPIQEYNLTRKIDFLRNMKNVVEAGEQLPKGRRKKLHVVLDASRGIALEVEASALMMVKFYLIGRALDVLVFDHLKKETNEEVTTMELRPSNLIPEHESELDQSLDSLLVRFNNGEISEEELNNLMESLGE